MLVETVGVALWAMLPAYVPNNAAVLFGGGPPIDGGREWRGRRLLGDGKTWRGTVAGILVGALVAAGLNVVRPAATDAFGFELPFFPLHVALALAVGAMFGDIAASFIKRRTGRRRGASFPGLDQLDFVVAAFAATALLAPSWFLDVFTFPRVAVVLVATPLLHLGTNAGAYVLGLKDEPY